MRFHHCVLGCVGLAIVFSVGCDNTSPAPLCGNAIVESEELCDDGNKLNHDGCTSTCETELSTWTVHALGPKPDGDRAMAYDSQRQVTVLFDSDKNTWEWDGIGWTKVAATGPTPVPRGAMAYDSQRQVAVLFGGYEEGSGKNNDIWEWDGTSWTLAVTNGSVPTPRTDHAMAYDSQRGVIVLFGGQTGLDGPSDETWEWDGTSWTLMVPTGDVPTPRVGHSMSFDSDRGVTVLFGGKPDGGNSWGSDETWEWDGIGWTLVAPVGEAPAARHGHSMSFDSDRGVTVLFAGDYEDKEPRYSLLPDDVWEWDGTSWTQIANDTLRLGNGPTVYDSQRGVTLFFGTSTFEWDGTRWTGADRPTFGRHVMAYDLLRGVVVLFGGGVSKDTWEWDDGWKRILLSGIRPSQVGPIVYNAAREVTVLFSGGSVWEWNGSDWTETVPVGNAPEAATFAVAYDSLREVVVCFGGSSGEETWEWDGSSWTLLAPSGSLPPPRQGHAMSYDVRRGVTMLFGGWKAGTYMGDTWAWDGSNWTEVGDSGSTPTKRSGAVMVYDPQRAVTVVIGGRTYEQETPGWSEWDGSKWSNESWPPDIGFHTPTLVYAAKHNMMLTFGGSRIVETAVNFTWVQYLNETMTLGYEGDHESCWTDTDGDGDGLIGCADPDCWSFCTPMCLPFSEPQWPTDCDASLSHCGDLVCNPALETSLLCPSDC